MCYYFNIVSNKIHGPPATMKWHIRVSRRHIGLEDQLTN
jgi:hypothetical protein